MRLLKILPIVTIASAAFITAQSASARRTVIDGGASLTLSGYCSPDEAAVVIGGCSSVALPFSVVIGAETFNSVYVNSNGTLSFNSIAPQLALQNSFTGNVANAASYTGPLPADSLGDYSAPIFSPNFVDGPGYGLINFSGPSPGYDGTFASSQTLIGNSLTVNFFTCTDTVNCGPATIAAITNAIFDPNGFGLTELIRRDYSPNPTDFSEANFELGRANALALLTTSLDIYTITLTGLSDGFSVAFTYSPGALGNRGTSGFNMPGGLNESTAPLANSSFRFTNGQTVAGVPEPSTWITMLLGFAAIGAALRRRKAEAKLAAA